MLKTTMEYILNAVIQKLNLEPLHRDLDVIFDIEKLGSEASLGFPRIRIQSGRL